jgi:outer membrane protein assembly factor BamB
VARGIVYVHAVDGHLDAFDATATTNCTGSGAGRTCMPRWRAVIDGTTPSLLSRASSPAVVGGVVYVGSDAGKVYAFDAQTGARRWATTTGDIVRSSPAVVGDVVYVGSDDGNLYALDAATGTPRWTATIGSRVVSSPAVVNGTVYVGADDGVVRAYDATSGALRWSASTIGFVLSSPAVVGGVVYVGAGSYGSGTGQLDAFDAAGVTNCSPLHPSLCGPLWSTATDGRIDSSPAVANGIVYAGMGLNGSHFAHPTFQAYDARTGAVLWTSDVLESALSSPAVANGVVYIGSDNGTLYAFDAAGNAGCSGGAPKTCAPLWTTGGATGLELAGSPAVVDGRVYWGSEHRPLEVDALP